MNTRRNVKHPYPQKKCTSKLHQDSISPSETGNHEGNKTNSGGKNEPSYTVGKNINWFHH
jgi:hypothetical protein